MCIAFVWKIRSPLPLSVWHFVIAIFYLYENFCNNSIFDCIYIWTYAGLVLGFAKFTYTQAHTHTLTYNDCSYYFMQFKPVFAPFLSFYLYNAIYFFIIIKNRKKIIKKTKKFRKHSIATLHSYANRSQKLQWTANFKWPSSAGRCTHIYAHTYRKEHVPWRLYCIYMAPTIFVFILATLWAWPL